MYRKTEMFEGPVPSPTIAYPQRAESHLITTSLRFLVILLGFSFWLPELRIGFSGFSYTQTVIGEGDTVVALAIPWFHEIIIILMFLLFIMGVLTQEISFKFDWSLTCLFAMVLVALFVIPFSQAMGYKAGQAAFGHIRYTLEGLFTGILASRLNWRARDLRWIVWSFIGGAVFHSLFVFFAAHNIQILPLPCTIDGEVGRYGGLFPRASRYSLYITLGISLLFTLMLQDLRFSFKNLVIYPLLLIIALIGLTYGQTRTAILALPLLFLLALFQSGKQTGKWFGRIMICILILIGIISIFLLTDYSSIMFERFGHGFIKYEGTSARGYIWPLALKTILYHPFGIGYDTMNFVIGKEIAHAHNMYLMWGVMFGIPGFILFYYFIFKLFFASRKLIFKDLNLQKYFLSIKVAFVIYLFIGLSNPFLLTYSGIWFWLFAGILASVSREQKQLNLSGDQAS